MKFNDPKVASDFSFSNILMQKLSQASLNLEKLQFETLATFAENKSSSNKIQTNPESLND